MKVLVIGANGKIGKIATRKLHVSEEHEVVAGLRKQEQIIDFEVKGYETALLDLEGEISAIEDAMDGIDAVVFSAGSGGETGAEKTMMVDLDGAVKAIIAAKNKGIEHFVMVSAVHSNHREYWSYGGGNSSIGSYYHAAKHYADEALKNSGLNYTIIRPVALTDEMARGSILISEDLTAETDSDANDLNVSREDVASTIVNVIGRDKFYNVSFDIASGETNIAEALANL